MSNKTQKTTRRRASLLPAALVAFGIVALAVGAVLLSMSPGGQPSGPEQSQRPYVGGDLHSLAVDPTDPEKVVVGGHEGGAVSTNGGKTWQTVAPIPGGMVMSISQDWEIPDTFYAANGSEVLKSTDGGKTWRPVGGELPGVSAVAVSPSNPQIVYAGVLEGDTASVYRSGDGGENWEARN